MEEHEHHCIGKEESLEQTKTNIAKYGLQVILVSGTNYSPTFAYSIGLFETYQQPEVICFGLSNKVGHQIINDVADLMKRGETIKTYTDDHNIFENARAQFLPVDDRNIGDYFGQALNYYGATKFPAIQLVWTDTHDKFPWEENFEERFLRFQPLLDRNADFKFREARNVAIFTTRQWLDLGQPILRVVHDIDGDWQFLTGDQMPNDIRIVSLEQMVIKDKTLNEVFDLDYGYSMNREFIGGPWTTTKVEIEEDEE